jgi:hypothetical protein
MANFKDFSYSENKMQIAKKPLLVIQGVPVHAGDIVVYTTDFDLNRRQRCMNEYRYNSIK